MDAPVAPHLSWDEYVALEAETGLRHELVGGLAYAMTGGTARHSLLSGAIFAALRPAAVSAGCRAHQHVMKLQITENTFYYPDVMVACGPLAGSALYEVAPALIVEVTSPSTVLVDRREKVAAYLSLPSLRAYLVFDQHQPLVEIHERGPNGTWVARGVGPGAVILLDQPPMTLSVDDLYSGLPD